MSGLGIALSASIGYGFIGTIPDAFTPPPPPADPEAGLTLSGELALGASDVPVASTFFNQEPVVLAFDIIGLNGSGGGMLFESGGSEAGTYIGFRPNGDFVVRTGDGAAPWDAGTSYLLLPAAESPSGDGTLVVSFDTLLGELNVWWQGAKLEGVMNGTPGPWTGTGSPANYLNVTAAAPTGEEIATVASYTSASPLRYYNRQIVSGFLTSGLTQTHAFAAPTAAMATPGLDRAAPTVLAFDITGLDGSAGGIILELGGSTADLYVGFRDNGDFVARAFDGGEPWSGETAYLLVPAAEAPSGTGRMVVTVDPDAATIAVYWNGTQIGAPVAGAAPGQPWAGGNHGEYLAISANGALGEVLDGVVNYSAAGDLVFYGNQRLGEPSQASPGYGVVSFDDGATPTVTISGGTPYDGTYTSRADGGAIETIAWMRLNGPQCILSAQASGIVAAGEIVTVKPGLWIAAGDTADGTDLPGLSLSGQWQDHSGDIAGETGLTAQVTATAASMTYVETATQPGTGQAVRPSNTLT
ncbi:MAG: hypothetical protein AAGA15_00015 [Pseudomonadota bacterium]